MDLMNNEIFINSACGDNFDYTEWRRENLFGDMTLEELVNEAAEFEQQHPESIPQNAKII